jgi:CDP-glucose 4,6-dehydratase
LNPDFWRGRRVLLTGHTGFKGSWLSLWLQSLGAEVTGFALAPAAETSLFDAARLANGMHSVTGDIRDLDALIAVMRAAQPEVVFHLAAQALVRPSYDAPVETYATNVMGTVHLLEAVRHTGSVRAVVNVTTDKCYENREWVWGYRENDALGGYDPYSSSKGCSELVTAAWRSSYFNPAQHERHRTALASARAGNVIGGGDASRDRLIPDVLAAFERGAPVRLRQPHAIRPWQHVLEPLRGYLMLAEQLHESGPRFAQAWNFGPRDTDAQSVQQVVEQMCALWGPGARLEIDDSPQPHEAAWLKLDISKAVAHLGWRPRLSLADALALTIDWSRQHRAGVDPRALTLAQIQAYQAAICRTH